MPTLLGPFDQLKHVETAAEENDIPDANNW
jgi:hypothetical protein